MMDEEPAGVNEQTDRFWAAQLYTEHNLYYP